MKYSKQAHEINVRIEPHWGAAEIIEAFERRHAELYGTRLGHGTTIVTARLTVIAALPRLTVRAAEATRNNLAPQPARKTAMPGVSADVAVFERALLSPGAEIEGPCLVEEVDTSFFLPEGAAGRIDVFANLIVTVK
jgi:N-methylhydantoinase A